MKKKSERFEKLAILAVAIALMVAFIALTASTADDDKPPLTTSFRSDVSRVIEPAGPRPIIQDPIIWDNGSSNAGYYLSSSQNDVVYPFVSQTADDFMLVEDMLVTDVHWWGGFWNGPPDEVEPCPFYIYFYADDGTGNAPTGAGMADPSPTALASYYFPGVSGLPLDPNGYHEYNVDLSPPFPAAGGVKYWIAIQADFPYPPQWGWTDTDGIQLHSATQGFPFLGTVFWTDLDPAVDMAYYLTGIPDEPWPNHKMHFPQLPDEIGWDVNATFPKTLADDWECSETGWVTDIHFWGSWRRDSVWTPMPWFILSIHENIPAGVDTPWSHPGRELWHWEGEVVGTPFDPPTYQGWYDPNTGQWFCNDHTAYWRYDFFFDNAYPPPDSFFQFEGQIYWLNVSALDIPPPFEWGWKNTTDHFMDDATYTDNAPWGPWFPLIEPPRCNWFDVYFPSPFPMVHPEDLGSTNYYGQGWYFYEQYAWWNMWFYNNPFTYENPKHIQLEFYVDFPYPHSWAEFALNWSTDIWSIEGEPGRPPLPEDGNEDLYIGRYVHPVVEGWNFVDYWIDDYNPEWVSIDFRAEDVMINGWIYHECVPTSLDLAFVITGVPGEPPVLCGDVNNNGVVDVGDVVYLVAYLYKGGPPPIPMVCVGDVNNNDIVDVGDLVYLVGYLYKGGPPPDPNCCNPPWKK